MTRKRALAAGFTDYTGVSMDDMLAHLRDWKTNTDNTIALLEKHLATVLKNAERLDKPDELESFITHFLDLFRRYSADFGRLLAELPQSVEERHIDIVRQIYDSSQHEDGLCVMFKREHISRPLKDESLRVSLIDRIYGDTRDMIVDYVDLNNLVHRLRTFVGTKTVTTNHLTSDDIDAFELKPNFFGIGLNLNHIIKRVRDFFRRR
ncbi:MAG TPA: hypothetical protein PLT37_10940 [Kiritimatiellia bacterium]|nr:hypothetical protein [Kiritimatiellia bacterium]